MHVVDPDDPKKKPKEFVDINQQIADASKASAKGFKHSSSPLFGGELAEGFLLGRNIKKQQEKKEAKRREKAGKGEL